MAKYSLAVWDTLLAGSCNSMDPFELVEPCQVLLAFAKAIEAVAVAMVAAVAVAVDVAVGVVLHFHLPDCAYINISFHEKHKSFLHHLIVQIEKTRS